MLGNAADQFFLGQMAERVSASLPNGHSRSMMVPDRERAGTSHVTAKAAQMPGPQRQVSSAWMPGMGTSDAPPTPPSLQPSSALPGMGGITIDTTTLLGLAAAAVGAYWLLFHKKPAA
jgi:hypothetical protein